MLYAGVGSESEHWLRLDVWSRADGARLRMINECDQFMTHYPIERLIKGSFQGVSPSYYKSWLQTVYYCPLMKSLIGHRFTVIPLQYQNYRLGDGNYTEHRLTVPTTSQARHEQRSFGSIFTPTQRSWMEHLLTGLKGDIWNNISSLKNRCSNFILKTCFLWNVWRWSTTSGTDVPSGLLRSDTLHGSCQPVCSCDNNKNNLRGSAWMFGHVVVGRVGGRTWLVVNIQNIHLLFKRGR